MKAVVVYREHEDYTRDVEEFVRDFEQRTGKEIERIDPDTIKGEIFVTAHDVVEYPTIMGLDDNGKVLDMWRGRPLPRIDEVAFYAKERKL